MDIGSIVETILDIYWKTLFWDDDNVQTDEGAGIVMSRKTPTKIFKRKSTNNTNDNVNVINKSIQDKTKEKLFLSFLLMFENVVFPKILKMLYVRCKNTNEDVDINNLYVRVKKRSCLS